MWKLSEVLLNREVKETNITSPNSNYISADNYPEQDQFLLDAILTLEFTNQYKCNVNKALSKPAITIIDGEKVSLRPHDDYQFLKERVIPDPDGDYNKDTWEEDFIVLRADLVEPYVLIAVSEDYSVLLVSSTKLNDMGHYEFIDNPTIYALQYNEFYGATVKTHYMDENFINDTYYDAAILRVDYTEPCKIVLMEYINNEVRFVLGDEVTVIYYDRPENPIKDNEITDYRKNLLEEVINNG